MAQTSDEQTRENRDQLSLSISYVLDVTAEEVPNLDVAQKRQRELEGRLQDELKSLFGESVYVGPPFGFVRVGSLFHDVHVIILGGVEGLATGVALIESGFLQRILDSIGSMVFRRPLRAQNLRVNTVYRVAPPRQAAGHTRSLQSRIPHEFQQLAAVLFLAGLCVLFVLDRFGDRTDQNQLANAIERVAVAIESLPTRDTIVNNRNLEPSKAEVTSSIERCQTREGVTTCSLQVGQNISTLAAYCYGSSARAAEIWRMNSLRFPRASDRQLPPGVKIVMPEPCS